jgi:iron complex outermembrane recepter protein
MRISTRRLALALSASTLAIISSSAAYAQGGLEEITVTARRQEENLMAIPIAISAVSADQIQAAGIKDMSTLSAYTPGLHIDQGLTNSLTRFLTFRGLAVSSGQVFVDGISLAGNGTPYLGALDHVEVLVGPQAVYFGRATFQGALNFVTKKPADHFSGRAYGEFGSYGTHEVALTLEGPIIADKLGVRVTARGFETDGQWRNASSPDQLMGGRESRSFIGTAYITPNDQLTAKITNGMTPARRPPSR